MAKARTRDGEGSKLRILDAAEEEFGAQGFAGARLGAIAERAGVRTNLIHFHFADKEVLYGAVMARALGAVTRDVRALMEGPAGLFGAAGPVREEQLALLGDALVSLTQRFYTKHGAVLSVLRREPDGRSRAAFEAEIKPAFELVIAALDHLRDGGIIAPDIDSRALFLEVVSMCAYPIVEPIFVDMIYPPSTRDLVFEDRLRRQIVTTALARMFSHRVRQSDVAGPIRKTRAK